MTKLTSSEFHDLIRRHVWHDFNEAPLVPEQELLAVNTPVVWPRPIGLFKKRMEFELYTTPGACIEDRVCEQDLDLPEISLEMDKPDGVYTRGRVGNSNADEYYIRVGAGVLYVRVGAEEDENGDIVYPRSAPNIDRSDSGMLFVRWRELNNRELDTMFSEVVAEVRRRIRAMPDCDIRHLQICVSVFVDGGANNHVVDSIVGGELVAGGQSYDVSDCSIADVVALLTKLPTQSGI